MAEEIVGVKIEVDGSSAGKSIGQLRKEIELNLLSLVDDDQLDHLMSLIDRLASYEWERGFTACKTDGYETELWCSVRETSFVGGRYE